VTARLPRPVSGAAGYSFELRPWPLEEGADILFFFFGFALGFRISLFDFF
jgi:hypothetical protein